MAEIPRIYLDACCFIDIAKTKIGRTLTLARESDVWLIQKYLEANAKKDAIVFTSVLTIAECLHADGVSDMSVRSLFTRLLTSGQHVTLVQPTPFLATEARDLRWKHGVEGIRGADYIHIQSAIATRCSELLTTDRGISENAESLQKLGLRVSAPRETELLPSKYRQGSMLDGDKITGP